MLLWNFEELEKKLSCNSKLNVRLKFIERWCEFRRYYWSDMAKQIKFFNIKRKNVGVKNKICSKKFICNKKW